MRKSSGYTADGECSIRSTPHGKESQRHFRPPTESEITKSGDEDQQESTPDKSPSRSMGSPNKLSEVGKISKKVRVTKTSKKGARGRKTETALPDPFGMTPLPSLARIPTFNPHNYSNSKDFNQDFDKFQKAREILAESKPTFKIFSKVLCSGQET